jgi:hypothetical protein
MIRTTVKTPTETVTSELAHLLATAFLRYTSHGMSAVDLPPQHPSTCFEVEKVDATWLEVSAETPQTVPTQVGERSPRRPSERHRRNKA